MHELRELPVRFWPQHGCQWLGMTTYGDAHVEACLRVARLREEHTVVVSVCKRTLDRAHDSRRDAEFQRFQSVDDAALTPRNQDQCEPDIAEAEKVPDFGWQNCVLVSGPGQQPAGDSRDRCQTARCGAAIVISVDGRCGRRAHGAGVSADGDAVRLRAGRGALIALVDPSRATSI